MTTLGEQRAQQTELVRRRYPHHGSLRSGLEVDFRLMGAGDREAFLAFARSLPPDDLLYLRIDPTDPANIDRLIEDIGTYRRITVLACAGATILGEATLIHSEADWTRHIGQIRVITAADARGKGLGRFLAEEIFAMADTLGLDKLSAQMTNDQVGAQAVFRGLGFEAVALLPGFVIARDGTTHDLLVMAYDLRRRGAPSPA